MAAFSYSGTNTSSSYYSFDSSDYDTTIAWGYGDGHSVPSKPIESFDHKINKAVNRLMKYYRTL